MWVGDLATRGVMLWVEADGMGFVRGSHMIGLFAREDVGCS